MCYFFRLDHTDNYKAKKQNTVKTNFCNASKPQNLRSNSALLKLTIKNLRTVKEFNESCDMSASLSSVSTKPTNKAAITAV